MKEYITVEKLLRAEAQAYVDRAHKYLNMKELDKAIGCLNKAIRKIKRADVLKLLPLEEAIFGPALSQLSDRIAKSIMEGNM